jgi:hypothetical protein
MSEIDWGLLNTNRDTNTDFNQAALQGVQRQQEVGGLNALQGVDLNNPQSVQNALGNSIKSGNLKQASDILGFQFNQATNSMVLNHLKNMGQVPANQAGGPNQSQPAPAAPGASVATPDQTQQAPQQSAGPQASGINYGDRQIDPKAAAAHIDKISSEIDQAKAIADPAERLAYAQKIAPDLHIDPAKVTADSITDDKLDSLKAQLGVHKDIVNGNISNVPSAVTHVEPQPSQFSNTNDFVNAQMKWARGILSDPWNTDPITIGLMKSKGIDMEPVVQAARAVIQPYNQEQAKFQYAGPTAEAQEAAKAKWAPAIAEGTERGTQAGKPFVELSLQRDVPGLGEKGAKIQLPPDQAYHYMQLAAPGTFGQLSEQTQKYLTDTASEIVKGRYEPGIQGAIAGAQAQAKLPYTVETPNINGAPIAGNYLPNGKGGLGFVPAQVAGSGQAVAGVTPDEQTDRNNGVDYVKSLNAKDNTGMNQFDKYAAAKAAGQRVLNTVGTVATGKYGPLAADITNATAFLGKNAAQYATKVDLLKQDLATNLKNGYTGTQGVRTQKEFDALTASVPKLTNQSDVIKLAAATGVAQANWADTRDRFIQHYMADPNSDHKQSSALLAWDTLAKDHSYLDDPIFNKVTVNGKPAKQLWAVKK